MRLSSLFITCRASTSPFGNFFSGSQSAKLVFLWQHCPSPGAIITTAIYSVGERTFKQFKIEF
jgi:hypothetical protein